MLQATGAAVTGAVLAYGACQAFAATKHHSEQACRAVDGPCFTSWGLAVVPFTFTTALIVLIIVYKRLGIGPRVEVIAPTMLLAPILLGAAQSTGGWWAATVVGGAWSCSLTLAVRSRCRLLGLSMAATLLLASLVTLYGQA